MLNAYSAIDRPFPSRQITPDQSFRRSTFFVAFLRDAGQAQRYDFDIDAISIPAA
jgi:hypothetical protein